MLDGDWPGGKIATNNQQIVARVVGALTDSKRRFAVLHGAERISTGQVVSDLDLVVDHHPVDVIRTVSREIADDGLRPVMEWSYDVAETMTVFIANRDGTAAMQLDMLHDHRGLGRYSVLSDALVARNTTRHGLPVLDPIDELVYLIRKRSEKKDAHALGLLVEQAGNASWSELEASMEAILTRAGQESVRRVLRGDSPRRPDRMLRAAASAGRAVQRLTRPTGFVVQIPESAPELPTLIERIRGWLPVVESHEGVLSASERLRVVYSMMRPSVVFVEDDRGLPRIDIRLVGDDDMAAGLVTAMYERTADRLGLRP